MRRLLAALLAAFAMTGSAVAGEVSTDRLIVRLKGGAPALTKSAIDRDAIAARLEARSGELMRPLRVMGDGAQVMQFFDNATPIGDQFLFGIDPTWKVEQVADMNGDGQPDLLFRSMSSGLSFAWYTQYSGGNLSLAGSTPPLYSIDPVWEVVQLADWNRDGQPDLLFRNRDTGVVFVWYLNGTALAGSDFVIQIDPSWEIVPRH